MLVTGGAGFIGSHIVQELLKDQHSVVVIDNLSNGSRDNLPSGVKLVVRDVTADLSPIFANERFDAVIHQAAQISVPQSIEHPLQDLRVNLQGVIRVLEACRKFNVGKIVFASSAAVYGVPLHLPVCEDHPLVPVSPYGLTKKAAEEYLRIYHDLYGISYTILRYSNVYGPYQSLNGESGVIPIFINALCRGRVPTIHGDGSNARDYVYVADVARANVLSLTKGDCETLNVSTGTAINLNDLFAVLVEALDSKIKPKYGKARPGDIKHSALSNQAIRDILGWSPQVGLQEGILRTVGWARRLQHPTIK